jgi:hypothetical protein
VDTVGHCGIPFEGREAIAPGTKLLRRMHDVLRSRAVETRRTAMRQQSRITSRLRAQQSGDAPLAYRDENSHARERMPLRSD